MNLEELQWHIRNRYLNLKKTIVQSVIKFSIIHQTFLRRTRLYSTLVLGTIGHFVAMHSEIRLEYSVNDILEQKKVNQSINRTPMEMTQAELNLYQETPLVIKVGDVTYFVNSEIQARRFSVTRNDRLLKVYPYSEDNILEMRKAFLYCYLSAYQEA